MYRRFVDYQIPRTPQWLLWGKPEFAINLIEFVGDHCLLILCHSCRYIEFWLLGIHRPLSVTIAIGLGVVHAPSISVVILSRGRQQCWGEWLVDTRTNGQPTKSDSQTWPSAATYTKQQSPKLADDDGMEGVRRKEHRSWVFPLRTNAQLYWNFALTTTRTAAFVPDKWFRYSGKRTAQYTTM